MEHQQCTKCLNLFPELEFIKKRTECKKCVARERSRVRMKRKYVQDTFKKAVQKAAKAKQDRAKAIVSTDWTLWVTLRHKQLLRPQKAALHRLERVQPPKPRTAKAIMVRLRIIDDLDRALAIQLGQIAGGIKPDDIQEYM